MFGFYSQEVPLSVISIEVALIAAIMLTGDANPSLARDTMLAVIMIVLNALVDVLYRVLDPRQELG